MKNINRKIILLAGAGFIFIFSSFVWGSSVSFKKEDFLKNGAESKSAIVEEKPVHLPTPDVVKGLYMTACAAATPSFRERLVKMADETEINSLIINVKDETGKISFETQDETLKGTVSNSCLVSDMKEFIQLLHKKNIYAIARIAVFQDPYLAKTSPYTAVKNGAGGTWKDKKGLSWVSPCSKDVWDYIVKISKEAEKIGFDELNFDYIRFASDGNMANISYPLCDMKISKQELLENFFKYLSENLKETKIPLSADLFGFVSTNLDDLNIGQVLEKAAPHFDYICPMVYPSHYPPTYNGFKNPADHPYEVIKLAMDTAVRRLLNQEAGLSPFATTTPQFSEEETKRISSKIRPWLQDFDLGADYTADMIRKEKQAVYDAGLSSWLLWDPANKYTKEALD